MGCSEECVRHISISFDNVENSWKNTALMKLLKKFMMKASLPGGVRDPSNYLMQAFNNIAWAEEDGKGSKGWGKGGPW